MKINGIVIVATLVMSGCAIAPDYGKSEWEHTSHITAGPPFNNKPEQWMDTINAIVGWESGRKYVEMGVGYKLHREGLIGPDLTFTSRVGVKLEFKK